MKSLLKPALLAAVAAVLVGLPMSATAQQGGGGGRGGRGNFDPEQMRQRMMERYREVLGVTNDDEWKVIEPRIEKVTTARREVGFGGGMRGMFGGGRRGGQGGDQAQGNNNRRNFGPQPSAAEEALQKALDNGASNDQIKAKLQAYRDDKKQKQEKLEEAQADLKKVLNLKQEAHAVMLGLID